MVLKAPRGTHDILPSEAPYFQHIEETARRVFKRYGYGEIRTPIFEFTDLFARGIGEETDIVSKEMYTFPDRKGRSLTLRPEGTAPVARAMIEHNILKQQGATAKVYYLGPMFRYERPQAGRQRQFHTAGAEFFGCASPLADAEAIAMMDVFLRELGFEGTTTKINSIGNSASRGAYNEELRRLLAGMKDDLCGDCRRRSEINPLRVLDCKVPKCGELYRDLPVLGDFLDDESRLHYETVLEALAQYGVSLEKYPSLVRGFDYYSHTVFEICLEGLGSQDAVLGGGRYDGLVEELGGKPCPAVGAAFGVERLIMAMKACGIVPPGCEGPGNAVFVLALEESCVAAGAKAAQDLRAAGRGASFDFSSRGFKGGLKAANRGGFQTMLVIGGEELARGVAQVKDLASKEQREVSLDGIASEV